VNVLIVADTFPAADRNSADFRFSNLIGMIHEKHDVFFLALGEKRQTEEIGSALTAHYRKLLADSGVSILQYGVSQALRGRAYGCVLFEWYFTASRLINEVRTWQPNARIFIDAVDVSFNRFEAKARLTQNSEDLAHATTVKAAELSVYGAADAVITVTDDDAGILKRELPDVLTFTIPNIHPLQKLVEIDVNNKDLLFIGSFTHEPNIDAVHYFCTQILPLILEDEPQVKLRIVGNAPTADVLGLASDCVEVLGFVPETRPFLETSAISIAPLRFGGGMKGKIGEAMSLGLPVVTTSAGIEGFGLVPGEHALVGNTPQEFADAVIRLLRDRALLDQIRMAGYRSIRDNYSDIAVKWRVHDLFARLNDYPVKRLSPGARAQGKLKGAWEKHVGWRFGS
jgi:glycosyltransferase involved in cell wall biosynthesis